MGAIANSRTIIGRIRRHVSAGATTHRRVRRVLRESAHVAGESCPRRKPHLTTLIFARLTGGRVCFARIATFSPVSRGTATLTLSSAILLCSAGGCANHQGDDKTLKTRTVNVQAFSHAGASAVATGPTSASDTLIGSETASRPSASPTASTVQLSAASSPAAASRPAMEPARPLRPGDEVIVESVIGQVSGRPIFADEFLAPLSDKLRQEAERLSPTDFVASAREIINKRLAEVMRDQLFLAEAEASLTEQQQTGLLAFMKSIQEKTIAEHGGTLFGTQQKLAQEQEMTFEQYQEAQKNTALISNLLYQRIAPRVIVSWRDVQREYELRRAEFNPPPRVTLQRLRLEDDSQKDLIEQVKAHLSQNQDFDAMVKELALADYLSTVGGEALTMGPGGLSDVPVADTLKAALAKLKGVAGETTEPIDADGRTTWLHIAKIEQPPGKTLFDVQDQLIGELSLRRQNEEMAKYVQSLFKKGSFDEMDQMSRRILQVALLRYAR